MFDINVDNELRLVTSEDIVGRVRDCYMTLEDIGEIIKLDSLYRAEDLTISLAVRGLGEICLYDKYGNTEEKGILVNELVSHEFHDDSTICGRISVVMSKEYVDKYQEYFYMDDINSGDSVVNVYRSGDLVKSYKIMRINLLYAYNSGCMTSNIYLRVLPPKLIFDSNGQLEKMGRQDNIDILHEINWIV